MPSVPDEEIPESILQMSKQSPRRKHTQVGTSAMAASVVNEINHRVNDDVKATPVHHVKKPMKIISEGPSGVVVETSSSSESVVHKANEANTKTATKIVKKAKSPMKIVTIENSS